MQRYEFKVIPAPRRGEKARGVKTSEDRFALALTNLMNELGAEGWDYVRADSLPCDERAGFTGTKTTFHNVLVFRRAVPSLSAETPVSNRLILQDAVAASPRLGPAESPVPGKAPAIGPANPNLAAE